MPRERGFIDLLACTRGYFEFGLRPLGTLLSCRRLSMQNGLRFKGQQLVTAGGLLVFSPPSPSLVQFTTSPSPVTSTSGSSSLSTSSWQRSSTRTSSDDSRLSPVPLLVCRFRFSSRRSSRSSCFLRCLSTFSVRRRCVSSGSMGAPLQVCGLALWAGRPGPFFVFSHFRHLARRFWNHTYQQSNVLHCLLATEQFNAVGQTYQNKPICGDMEPYKYIRLNRR